MSDQFVGEIRMFAGNYAPEGWAICDGRLLNISEYEALFALIGTTYGGDGRQTFAVPDLRGRLPIGPGQSTAAPNATYSLGQTGGSEQVTLTSTQMPTHTHVARASNAAGTQTTTANNFWATGALPYAPASTSAPYTDGGTMDPQVIANAGGSQPHDNVMPYCALTYIIALNGNFPVQN